MRTLTTTFAALLMIGLTGLASAQDDPAGSEATEQQESSSSSGLDFTIEITKKILSDMFAQADLSEDQSTQINALIDAIIPEMLTKQDQFKRFLDKDQKKLFNAAMKQATNAKWDEEKATGYALRKLKLSEEKQKEYLDLKKQVAVLEKKLQIEAGALLTDEQKSKLSIYKEEMAAKPRSMKIMFPNMESDDDAKLIETQLMKIKDASDFSADLDSKTVTISLPGNIHLRREISIVMTKMTEGKEVMRGWKPVNEEKE